MNKNDGFFCFDKKLITKNGGVWRSLPSSTRSIIPSLMYHSNSNGKCFPSQATMAEHTGLSIRSINRGVSALNKLDGYDVDTKNKSYSNKVTNYIVNTNFEDGFIIGRSMIDSGRWSELSSGAKNLYLTLRLWSIIDHGDKSDDTGMSEYDKFRMNDVIKYKNKADLSRHSGISRNMINKYIDELKIKDVIFEDGGLFKIRVRIEYDAIFKLPNEMFINKI